MSVDFGPIFAMIRKLYPDQREIPLHAPTFRGKEREYLLDCLDSTFVSSVGPYVDRLEEALAKTCGTKYAVAVVNGTEALHVAMLLAGVKAGDEVITQPLTFAATANAISYCGAKPSFVDVERATLSLCPEALEHYLKETVVRTAEGLINRRTSRRIAACVPVHVFGHVARMEKLQEVCANYGLPLIEDAAESIGSLRHDRPAGSFGLLATLSFNGNKTITSGGGGAILTSDPVLAKRAKYLTTTAKAPHPWEFNHTELGFNYRMPNLNAALALAQLEQLPEFVANKRETAAAYRDFFKNTSLEFISEATGNFANYWLNAVLFKDSEERDRFLHAAHEHGILARPCWKLMQRLPMYQDSDKGDLTNACNLEDRLVNLPSSVRLA